jgi:hypothetical protein
MPAAHQCAYGGWHPAQTTRPAARTAATAPPPPGTNGARAEYRTLAARWLVALILAQQLRGDQKARQNEEKINAQETSAEEALQVEVIEENGEHRDGAHAIESRQVIGSAGCSIHH